ncbi:MAG: hypothetical protein AVDCRST_MAG49-3774, partial [uncultured Thermomicrobiales bacterium]
GRPGDPQSGWSPRASPGGSMAGSSRLRARAADSRLRAGGPGRPRSLAPPRDHPDPV